jgi:hypothetical protein
MRNTPKGQGKSSFFYEITAYISLFSGALGGGACFLDIASYGEFFCGNKKIVNCSIELFTIENLEEWCDFFRCFSSEYDFL